MPPLPPVLPEAAGSTGTESVEADESLAGLVSTLRSAARESDALAERGERLLGLRRRGRPWRELATREDQPLIVGLMTQLVDRLADAGSAFRRSEARALRAEGMSQAGIAELFGVTRQRVAALLQPAPSREARGVKRPRPQQT